MIHTKIKNSFFGLIIFLFIGCEGEVGPQGIGLNSLINVTNEPAGTNCENGGVRIEVGTDTNENGMLDSDEVVSTSYVCNGVDGATNLTVVTTEPVGTNCENGGLKIDSGVDANGNGTLDDTEISATAYVCNGIDGNNSLTKITNEAAGNNCENGGLKIDSGIDTNGDGTLDNTEISATAYICNGIDGNNSLTKITSEAAGANCENGGLKIDTGVDSDSNGTLDDTEITATAYTCNGLNGNVSLVNITNESAGANCENGGLKIDSGIDANRDGTLDDTEISATAYVCNGIDGNNSLTKITNEAAGANCENGGLKIDTGVDSDSNGTLDDSEITATAYTCNGLNGNVSLVNITNELAGANCGNGGVKIDSGVDNNSNGTLDVEEISITRYICNGADGGFDEQIYVRILTQDVGNPTRGFSTSSSSYQFAGIGLIDFDKQRYLDVDSVVFVANPYTFGSGAIELFNATDSESISNSEIIVTQGYENRLFLNSEDIFNNLPDKEIDLGVRVKSDGSQNTFSGQMFLVMYRTN